jgi:predicted N-acyltransferase
MLFSNTYKQIQVMKMVIAALESKCSSSRADSGLVQDAAHNKAKSAPPSSGQHTVAFKLSSVFGARYYSSARELPESWDRLLSPNQYFLSREYLVGFEQNAPENMDFAYLTIVRQQRVIGVMSFQLLSFNALDPFRSAKSQPEDSLWQRIKKWPVRQMLSLLNYRMLVSGALQFTGEYGMAFDAGDLGKEEKASLIHRSMDALSKYLHSQNRGPHLLLVKDYYEPLALETKQYHPVDFLPNMLIDIPAHWNSFEDYLKDLTSKYRVRARRAFKKAKQIEKRSLSLQDIERFKSQMYELYLEVEKGSDFSLIRLSDNYFHALRALMKENAKIHAYFLEGKMIGFCTALKNGTELEAHFLGFSQKENYEYQLYLNILFHMLELAIEEGAERLVFARTASVIKSSVGAVPRQMYCYIKHSSPLLNRLVPYVLRYIPRNEVWKQRHPFKEPLT